MAAGVVCVPARAVSNCASDAAGMTPAQQPSLRWMTHAPRFCVAGLLLVVACSTRSSAPDASTPRNAPAPVEKTPVAASPETGPRSPEADGSPEKTVSSDALEGRMHRHFETATGIAEAVIDGDLEGARESAAWLLEQETGRGLPSGWSPHVDRMKTAAEAVAEAGDIDAAAAATGTMLTTCGSCHAAHDVAPRFAASIEPTLAETPAGEMERHQWAIDRMREGLIGPSEQAWQHGARMLQAPPVCAATEASKVADRARVRTLARRVGALAEAARTAETPDARGRNYGDLLSTCAACHQSGC